MALREISKGLFLKKKFCYDESHMEFVNQVLQVPFTLIPFAWRGFIGEKSRNIQYDESIHYFSTKPNLFSRDGLFVMKSSEYDQLPTNENNFASDDADDLALQNLPDEMTEKKDEYNQDLYMRTDSFLVNMNKEALDDVLACLSASKALQMQANNLRGIFSHKYLAWDDKWAVHVIPKRLGAPEVDSVPIGLMAFFVRTKSLLKGSGIFCGYHRQLAATGVSTQVSDTFYKWCVERSPRLSAKGDEYKTSVWPNIIKPGAWIHPDHLTLTDDAFVYTRKTWRRDEMVYLPYNKTRMVMRSGGLITRHIEIYGEQNIIPKYSFKIATCQLILKKAKEHGVNEMIGGSYSCNVWLPKNWFGRSPRILLTDDGIIYYPNRLKKLISHEMDMNARVVNVAYSELSEVSWYKPFFSWYGTLVIHGQVNNIRQDQVSKSIYILMPSFSKFKYKGSVRYKLPPHMEEVIKRKKHQYADA